MLTSDLLGLIDQGEGAKLEFKRDVRLRSEQLAKVIVAFANMNGGTILLGVEDGGQVSGIQRQNLQEWLMDTVIRRYVEPQIIPDYQEIMYEAKNIAVIGVHRGTAKPYGVRKVEQLHYYLRMGATCQLAGRDQLARLFNSGGLVSVELFPVYGSSLKELDARRYIEYLAGIQHFDPQEDWQNILVDRGFLVGDEETYCCSYIAYALFAKQPCKRLPQVQVRFTVYSGKEKDYDTIYDQTLDAPFLEYRGDISHGNSLLEDPLHTRLINLITPYVSKESLSGGTRGRKWEYPQEVIRELIINALIHRDWSKQNYVRIVLYSNRLEIISPGGLPNGMTVEKIKSGNQVSRNPQFVRVFRDYGYMEDQGMGIRVKVIPLMRQHNGTEPDFEATEDYFKVTLWKK